ncbi:MAG: helix-turn-helix domain-containing protein [Acidobacteriota bacterium]
MAKKSEVPQLEYGSGNVFSDLGLRKPDHLKVKSGLAIEIARAVRALRLTQQEAAARMGISQPKLSGLLRGDFTNLSETKLMECLNRLGYDIEIKLRKAARGTGSRTVAVA